MQRRWIGVLVCTLICAAGATAQQYVTTSGTTTTGTLPVFKGKSAGTTTIGNSVITQNGNQMGVGVKNDTVLNPLLVLSNAEDGGGIGMMGVVDPSESFYGWAENDLWLRNASAPTPEAFLWAIGSEGNYWDSGELTNEDFYIYDPRNVIYNFAVDNNDNVYIGGLGFGTEPSALAVYAGANGNVGLGTTTPGARLEVNGSVILTKGSKGTITFADGTTQSTAYTGAMPGGDFAESVDVTGDRTKYVSGDVLVIDPDTPGKFLKSVEPYSTSVSGIYSTKPGAVGRRLTTPKSPDEVPMAMMGIVPTNVTAENGAIHPGDLLVTSSTLGYAMKGTDRSRMLGAVIGKALGSLDSGKGVIEVVVTLQ